MIRLADGSSSHGSPRSSIGQFRRVPFSADPGEEQLGRLVGRVLRDEFAAEGALEDGPAEGSGAALRPLDRGAERVDRRELLLDARDDPALHVHGPSDFNLIRTAAAGREEKT